MSGLIKFKVFGAPANASAETRKIRGTGGDLGTMRQLGEAFQKRHSGVTMDVLPCLGSGGIKAVLAGAIDIGLSALLVKTSSGRTCRRISQHRVRSERR